MTKRLQVSRSEFALRLILPAPPFQGIVKGKNNAGKKGDIMHLNQNLNSQALIVKPELARRVYQAAYLTGEFKLRSGQTSKEYFDKYRFEAQPELLLSIALHLAPMVPKGTQILAGLEMGGIPVATALSFATGLPCLFVRKKAKDYGTCQFAEGVEFSGKKVCLVEDVITTGGQALISAEDLRRSGALIEHALCVINRGEAQPLKSGKIELTSLFTMEELKQAGKT